MDVDRYLQRIGYRGSRAPTLATLRAMHRAHFLNVPFENLSIARGEPIVVDPAANFDKVVRRRRGGFCLELTGLFAWALRELGYRVETLGGRVLSPEGQLGEPLSHMALVVHLEEPWIADVGFGGRIIEPLRLAERGLQVFGPRAYAVAHDGDRWLVTCNDPWLGQGTARTYVIGLQPRSLEEFVPVCGWLQTSPDSAFTRGDVVSLGLEDGRITYSAGRFISLGAGEREERAVDPAELPALLRERFGLILDI